MHKINELLTIKNIMMLNGFVEGGECNKAKFMMKYHAKQEGLSKHLLIDIKKSFDKIDGNRIGDFHFRQISPSQSPFSNFHFP